MLDNTDYAANVKDAGHSKALGTLVDSEEGPTRTQPQIKRAWLQVATNTAKTAQAKGQEDPDEYQRLVLKAVKKRDATRMERYKLLVAVHGSENKVVPGQPYTSCQPTSTDTETIVIHDDEVAMVECKEENDVPPPPKSSPVATKVPPPSDESRTGLAGALGKEIDTAMNEVLEEIDTKVTDLKEYMKNKLLSMIDEEIGECFKHSHEMFKRDLS
ncbi:hypothetical protein QAD02_011963 [Eretmocerus hayati]|uniref:Uncharacterized protein n=1 Tax=Eretmocerus hayati TaxID=131215 RepID=A0ACC2NYI4_9HYME|nr:hypothetical protein QAD02_011963 [Eretmocerus hayati]